MSSIRWLILVGVVVSIAILAFSILNTSLLNEKNPNNKLLLNTSENRTINPYVKEYSLPAGTWPNGILVDKNGTVWVAGSKINSLFRFDPIHEKIQSYPIEDNNSQDNKTGRSLMVWTILQDNDGLIWFSQLGTDSIWRFDPNTGKFDSVHSISAAPFQMKLDKSGNIWFTTLSGNTVGVIQKIQNSNEKYQITEFGTGNDTQPAGLFLTNNELWLTEISKQKIVKYGIMYDNGLVKNIHKILEIPTDHKISLGSPTDLFVSNETIWLTEHGTSFLTKYQINSENLTRFPTSQNAYQVTTLPFWIREANNGKGIWFNEHEGNKIAFFNTVDRTLTEYEIPSRSTDGYLVYPLNIAIDQLDSNKLWFSEWNTDKFGMVDAQIPISFEIHSDKNKIVLGNDSKQQSVVIEISKNSLAPYDNNIVFLNASSSVEPNAGLGNVDVKFFVNAVDLSKTHQVQLLLRNDSAPPGNYTLGISGSDGKVTKTVFLDLEILK
ncbi:MAG: hypothetical protein E6L02_03305 [Thaumarchaeota archaeon]|nr:MAG: hypothetical protein E6L02_03305 [Nitrososphaerota archaeon]